MAIHPKKTLMNPNYKPTFLLLFFTGTLLTIIGIGLTFVLQTDTVGLIILGIGFFVQFINLILYYKHGRIPKE